MPNAAWLTIVVLLFVALLIGALWFGLRAAAGVRASARPPRERFRRGAEPPRRKRMAVIVNPTKFEDLAPIRERLAAAAAALDWDPPLILETTADDPGYGQARSAVDEGADVVAPLGGDGTVRVVASALVGTSTPLGLLPAGTGNLLARNLLLPVTDLEEAVRLACTGRNRAIDVGFATLTDTPDRPDTPDTPDTPDAETSQLDADGLAPEGHSAEHAFLVMAGVGLDATIMSDTTEAAKARLGWPAYVATGLRNFLGPRIRARVSVDGGEPHSVNARTILIGNVGRITAGINLMPDAVVDDGALDAVVLAPKGLPGWVNVTARVVTRNRGERTAAIQRFHGAVIEVRTETPQAVQLDGDVVGTANYLRVRVAPGALLVRT